MMCILSIFKINPAVFLFALTAFSTLYSTAQAPPVLIFAPVISSGLSTKSLDIVNAGDGSNRLFVVGLEGRIKIISGGAVLPTSFLDISQATGTDSFPTPGAGSERGLLSLAFHPDYNGTTNRYFFIFYCINTVPANIPCVRLTRFETVAGNPNLADQTTGKVLLTIEEPGGDHNGAKLNFGPDGNLYFGIGDGGGSNDPTNEAQNGNSLLGKMLRLNVDNFTTPPYYTIPADNPYVSDPAVRDEIFAIGFRNPWRWSFDRLNNDIWVGDVGEGTWEEINTGSLATFGHKNYGWRCYEGNEDHNTTGCLPAGNYTYPIFAYPHNSSTGGFAVTGGYVYRGTEYGAMYGYYICSDFISGNAWLIKPNGSGGWSVSQQSYVVSGGLPKFITSFGESENGVLYAVSYGGTLYKVTTNTGGPLPVTILQFTAKAATGYNSLGWKTVNEQNLSGYEIEFSNNGVNYVSAGKVSAVNTPLENNYVFRHYITGFTKLFYKLKITGNDGRLSYSDIIVIDKTAPVHVKIYPTLVTNNRLNIVSEKPVEAVVIFSAEGRKVFETRLNNSSGTINIPFPHLQKGVYIVQAKLADEYFSEKIIVQQE